MSEHRVPAGIHKGRGTMGIQYGTTTNGHDQIVIDLALSELGETVSTFLIFSDAAAPYAIERLRAMGWIGDDLSDLTGIDQNEVDVEVKYEMYDGKERMRVQILTGGGRVVLQNTMDDKGKKAFAAKFKGLAAASRSAAGKQPAADAGSFPFGANAPGGGQVPPQQRAGGVKL